MTNDGGVKKTTNVHLNPIAPACPEHVEIELGDIVGGNLKGKLRDVRTA